MVSSESDILASKIAVFRQAISDLPSSILGLKTSQLSYEIINQILNVLVPRVIRCDVRIFWAAFDGQRSAILQAEAMRLWVEECGRNPSLGESKAFVMYCMFLISNVQFNIIGSGNLIDRINQLTTVQIAHAAKISISNSNIMFTKIFCNNLSGTRPSGCALSLCAMLLIIALPFIFIIAFSTRGISEESNNYEIKFMPCEINGTYKFEVNGGSPIQPKSCKIGKISNPVDGTSSIPIIVIIDPDILRPTFCCGIYLGDTGEVIWQESNVTFTIPFCRMCSGKYKNGVITATSYVYAVNPNVIDEGYFRSTVDNNIKSFNLIKQQP